MAKKASGFEGSAADKRQDKAGAKRAGMSMKAFEGSPGDEAADMGMPAPKRKAPPSFGKKRGR